jgi:hypothetical protein
LCQLCSFPSRPLQAHSPPIEAFKAAIRNGCFTSTPAVREASSASFDTIGFRLADHDGCEFLAGQEPSSSMGSTLSGEMPDSGVSAERSNGQGTTIDYSVQPAFRRRSLI